MTFTKTLLLSAVATSLLLVGCGEDIKERVIVDNNATALQGELDALKSLNDKQKKDISDLQAQLISELEALRNDTNASTQAVIEKFKLENDAKIQELIDSGKITQELIYDLLFNKNTLANVWYEAGVAYVEEKELETFVTTRGVSKNVILFVGDSMGVSTLKAACIFHDQQ